MSEPSTWFGTRGSEVQILSPDHYFKHLHAISGLLSSSLRAILRLRKPQRFTSAKMPRDVTGTKVSIQPQVSVPHFLNQGHKKFLP